MDGGSGHLLSHRTTEGGGDGEGTRPQVEGSAATYHWLSVIYSLPGAGRDPVALPNASSWFESPAFSNETLTIIWAV